MIDHIRQILKMGGVLAISISGGKDGQAMFSYLTNELGLLLQPGKNVFAIHADLGRVEWPQTTKHCRDTTEQKMPLVIVKREQGDLLARWEERMQILKGQNKPFWSDAKNRYCTSDLKRGPINKYYRLFDLIISCEGIRAEESPARAKKNPISIRKEISSSYYENMTPEEAIKNYLPGKRLALTIYPIFDWTIEKVWLSYKETKHSLSKRRYYYSLGYKDLALRGWPFHPAYVFGNERLSCMFCILGSKNDLKNAAIHNPTLLNRMIEMEIESGFTFKNNWSLTELL